MPDPATEPRPAQNEAVGESVLVQFTDMAHGGDAVGRLGDAGLALFAWPGIKGEQANVAITSRRPNLLRGQVIEVVVPSPLRTTPPCPYFGSCGGCQWQHIEYAGQVQFKHDILHSQLERSAGITNLDDILKPPLASPAPFHYRNTSHFAIAQPSRSLGYFKRDTHTVIEVEQCPISNEGINRTIPLINGLLAESPPEDFLGAGARGVMRVWQVTLRSSDVTGHTLAIFHSRAEGAAKPRNVRGSRRAPAPARPVDGPGLEPDAASNPDIPLVRRQVRKAISALYRQQEGDGKPLALTVVEVMEDGTVNMLGATRAAADLSTEAAADVLTGSYLKSSSKRVPAAEEGAPIGAWVEDLGGRHYWVAPEAFFQANTPAADLLLSEVLEHVPAKVGTVIDAHAGVGTFALAAAQRARQVIAFELSNSAVTSGRWTAAVSGITNVEFRQGRAEHLMPRLKKAESPELILLDPPRTGCHPELIASMLLTQAARIIYVSCDPSTLARDIKALSAAYELTSARVVDMFPQTFHIETVVVLDRRAHQA